MNGEVVRQKLTGDEALPPPPLPRHTQISQFFLQLEGWFANTLKKGRRFLCSLISATFGMLACVLHIFMDFIWAIF